MKPSWRSRTDKINAEVEAPASGRLTHVQAQAGDSVKVIGLLALIAAPEDTDADLAAAVEAAKAAAERGNGRQSGGRHLPDHQTPAAPSTAPTPWPASTPGRGRRARHGLAGCPPPGTESFRWTSATVTGTGPRGRVVESDVRAAAEASAATPAASPGHRPRRPG